MSYKYNVTGDLRDGISVLFGEDLPADYAASKDKWTFQIKSIVLTLYKGHGIKANANLWVNLFDDLRQEPVFTEYVDSTRDDLTNITEDEGKRIVYLRGNEQKSVHFYNKRIDMRLDFEYDRRLTQLKIQRPEGKKIGKIAVAIELKIQE